MPLLDAAGGASRQRRLVFSAACFFTCLASISSCYYSSSRFDFSSPAMRAASSGRRRRRIKSLFLLLLCFAGSSNPLQASPPRLFSAASLPPLQLPPHPVGFASVPGHGESGRRGTIWLRLEVRHKVSCNPFFEKEMSWSRSGFLSQHVSLYPVSLLHSFTEPLSFIKLKTLLNVSGFLANHFSGLRERTRHVSLEFCIEQRNFSCSGKFICLLYGIAGGSNYVWNIVLFRAIVSSSTKNQPIVSKLISNLLKDSNQLQSFLLIPTVFAHIAWDSLNLLSWKSSREQQQFVSWDFREFYSYCLASINNLRQPSTIGFDPNLQQGFLSIPIAHIREFVVSMDNFHWEDLPEFDLVVYRDFRNVGFHLAQGVYQRYHPFIMAKKNQILEEPPLIEASTLSLGEEIEVRSISSLGLPTYFAKPLSNSFTSSEEFEFLLKSPHMVTSFKLVEEAARNVKSFKCLAALSCFILLLTSYKALSLLTIYRFLNLSHLITFDYFACSFGYVRCSAIFSICFYVIS